MGAYVIAHRGFKSCNGPRLVPVRSRNAGSPSPRTQDLGVFARIVSARVLPRQNKARSLPTRDPIEPFMAMIPACRDALLPPTEWNQWHRMCRVMTPKSSSGIHRAPPSPRTFHALLELPGASNRNVSMSQGVAEPSLGFWCHSCANGVVGCRRNRTSACRAKTASTATSSRHRGALPPISRTTKAATAGRNRFNVDSSTGLSTSRAVNVSAYTRASRKPTRVRDPSLVRTGIHGRSLTLANAVIGPVIWSDPSSGRLELAATGFTCRPAGRPRGRR